MHDEIDDSFRAQCASLGIDAERLVTPLALQGGPLPFELWPENAEAFEVFHACRHQWRVAAGFGALWYQGLDMTAVDVAMRRLGIPAQRERDVFLQLQVMEDEGVKVLNA